MATRNRNYAFKNHSDLLAFLLFVSIIFSRRKYYKGTPWGFFKFLEHSTSLRTVMLVIVGLCLSRRMEVYFVVSNTAVVYISECCCK